MSERKHRFSTIVKRDDDVIDYLASEFSDYIWQQLTANKIDGTAFVQDIYPEMKVADARRVGDALEKTLDGLFDSVYESVENNHEYAFDRLERLLYG